MTESLSSGTFNEGIRTKRFWSCFKSVGNVRIKSARFPASTWEQGHFLFSTFQTFNYSISKNIQANPCGFIRDNKKGSLMCQVSMKYMKPDGKGNDLKIASFFSFLQNVDF